MKAVAKDAQHRPVLKVKTTVKAGYYLGLTLSAGGGMGVPNTAASS